MRLCGHERSYVGILFLTRDSLLCLPRILNVIQFPTLLRLLSLRLSLRQGLTVLIAATSLHEPLGGGSIVSGRFKRSPDYYQASRASSKPKSNGVADLDSFAGLATAICFFAGDHGVLKVGKRPNLRQMGSLTEFDRRRPVLFIFTSR